jgi:hypothetical protein
MRKANWHPAYGYEGDLQAHRVVHCVQASETTSSGNEQVKSRTSGGTSNKLASRESCATTTTTNCIRRGKKVGLGRYIKQVTLNQCITRELTPLAHTLKKI